MGGKYGGKRVQSQEEKDKNRANGGFRTLVQEDREYQRQIASSGGTAAHAKGTANKFKKGDKKTRDAARKSGLLVSRDREHMSKLGKKGGQDREHMAKISKAGVKESNRIRAQKKSMKVTDHPHGGFEWEKRRPFKGEAPAHGEESDYAGGST